MGTILPHMTLPFNSILLSTPIFFMIANNIPPVYKLAIGIIMIFVLAFLLEVGHIWIIVNRVIKVMDFLISQHPLRFLQQLVIVVQAKLSLSVIQLVGIAVVMTTQRFES